MAKKRAAVRRKTAKAARPARRRTRRKSSKISDTEETMNIIAGILVVILIGLGIYFYQASQKSGAIAPPTQVAMITAQ
jgi:cell division protein FtsL